MTVKDLLSQDEIDALLHGVDGGEVETQEEEPQDTGEVRVYDLASHERIVRGRMPTLEMINERFARHTRISLFNLLRRNADVSVGGVQIMKYGDYIHTLYVPTSINLLRVSPLREPRCWLWMPSWFLNWWITSSVVMAVTLKSRAGNLPRLSCV